jgi:hypothetical protein
MAIRILQPSGKIGVVFVGGSVALLTGAAVGGATDEATLVGPVVLTVWVIVLYGCSRSFRGPTEDVRSPRSWWRATEKPTAGWIVGIIQASGTVGSLSLVDGPAWIMWYSLVLNTAVASWFIQSSVRLRRFGPEAV